MDNKKVIRQHFGLAIDGTEEQLYLTPVLSHIEQDLKKASRCRRAQGMGISRYV